MGCQSSKTISPDVHYEAELRSTFKDLSHLLPELRRFFVPASAMSLTIGLVPELKEVISKNPGLLYFLKEYFKNNMDTLKFLAELKRYLAKARDHKAIIHEALRCLEGEGEHHNVMKKKKYSTLSTSAERFQIFQGLLTKEFTRASKQHKDMVSGLHRRKLKLDKKLSFLKIWRKVWSVACGVVFVAALMCSVVLAVVGAPHVAVAAATTAPMVVKSVEQWLDLLWASQEDAWGCEQEVVRKIYMDNFFVIHELNSVAVHMARIMNYMGSLSWDVGFTSRNKEARVMVGIDEMKRKLGDFSEIVDNLERELDFCTREMGRVLAEVLKSITKEV